MLKKLLDCCRLNIRTNGECPRHFFHGSLLTGHPDGESITVFVFFASLRFSFYFFNCPPRSRRQGFLTYGPCLKRKTMPSTLPASSCQAPRLHVRSSEQYQTCPLQDAPSKQCTLCPAISSAGRLSFLQCLPGLCCPGKHPAG